MVNSSLFRIGLRAALLTPVVGVMSSSLAVAQLYQDATKPISARVHDLIGRMRLEEKVRGDAERRARDSKAGSTPLRVLERGAARSFAGR